MIIFLFIKINNIILFLIWIQIAIYLLHQFEEHAWPGEFRKYFNKEILIVESREYPLNNLNIFWINLPVNWLLMPMFAALSYINLFLVCGFLILQFLTV